MVWLTFAFDPCTVTLPAFVDIEDVFDLSLALSCVSSEEPEYNIKKGVYNATCLNPVLELDFTTSINADMLQSFTDVIIRLPLRLESL